MSNTVKVDIDDLIDFSGYEAAEVLCALHDNAPPVDNFYYKLGRLDEEYAEQLLDNNNCIQYLNGRYLYLDFSHFPLMDPCEYDRCNGENCMNSALETLFKRNL